MLSKPLVRSLLLTCVILAALLGASLAAAKPAELPGAPERTLWRTEIGAALRLTGALTPSIYLPIAMTPLTCQPIGGATFESMPVADWQQAEFPTAEHPDINLAVRGYVTTTADLNLIDVGGDTDPNAPQMAGLFGQPRAPVFRVAYQVNNWDWGCHCTVGPIDDPAVTLANLAATQGETLHLPNYGGSTIGGDFDAFVLYADETRITLKYTSQDNMIAGYGLHLENICVDANLLALYRQLDAGGRHSLPALHAGQAFGRARTNQFGLAIRDNGAFMDPRVRKDWWRNY